MKKSEQSILDSIAACVREEADPEADAPVDLTQLPREEAERLDRQVESFFRMAWPYFERLRDGLYTEIRAVPYVMQPPGEPRAATFVHYFAVEDGAEIGAHPDAPDAPMLFYRDGRMVEQVVIVPWSMHDLFQLRCAQRLLQPIGHA